MTADPEPPVGRHRDPGRRRARPGARRRGSPRTRRPAAHPRGPVRRAAWRSRRRDVAVRLRRRVADLRANSTTRANRLARLLIARGGARKPWWPWRCRASVDLVVALLAVVKSGAGYLPVDVTYPADRLAFVLERRPAGVCAHHRRRTSRRFRGDRGPGGRARRPGDRRRLAAAVRRCRSPTPTGWRRCDPDSVAYVIYTSGSTGQPKGVSGLAPQRGHAVGEHRSRCSDSTRPTCGRCSTRTRSTSRCGSCGVRSLYGGRLVRGRLLHGPLTRDVPRTAAATRRVTVLNQTPTAFYQLAEADRVAGRVTGLSLCGT